MARCLTCHRRLRSGQSCPVHHGAAAELTRIQTPPFAWPEPLGACVGAGGFASVWALSDRVVKVAHASHELARARMGREAEALRAIGAPAVPRCFDSGVLADGRAWIVMDRVDGTNVAELTANGAMRAAEGVAIGLAILDALERVHAARFVHRDLKPDNLVRTHDARIVILDLGLARKLPVDPDDPTRARVQVGSLEYIAPEQIADSAAVDERSDLYSFGCVLYELLAGRPPFVGDAAGLERAHTALRPPRLRALASVTAAVETLVHDCLAKDPSRRPASAAEARDRLAVAHDERTPPSAGHSVSMIREGKQPVVLLWAELPRVDRALLATLTGRRLVIVSQRGRKLLAGVLGGEHADPASIAIAAARELAAAGARVALHLEALRVVTSGGATTLHGAPIEKPESWLPSTTWSGVAVSDALASVTQAPTRPLADREAESAPGYRALADDEQRVELVGREALLSDLAVDAAVALRGVPTFALLVGDAGIGKTAFAGALAKRVGELGARVHLGTVPSPGGGKPGHSALANLIGTPRGPVVRAIGDALRVTARAQPTAVILDDLHFAEHDLLDALEYATLGGEPLALWVLGIASPRLVARRPSLGSRAERSRRDVLPPLDEDAAVALTAALLRPAEYPPLRALRRLAAIAQGNPLHLITLAREIHQRGAIRERAGGAYFLDTTALDDLSPAALGPWLAARELAGLSSELIALARLCAVLGGEVQRDELLAIVEAVERAGGATTTIEVDVGLRELVTAGVLVQTARGYRFRQALVEEGVYATTNEEERLALHRAALEYWQRAPVDDIAVAERIAHHADALGERAIAAAAHAALARAATVAHRALEADQAWSNAIRNLDQDDQERARALLGRAGARYRVQRIRDALVDLDEVIEIARATHDLSLELEAVIERGTALDWAEDWEGSARAATEMRRLYTLAPRPDLEPEVELAEARALFRAQQFAAAEPKLARVRETARAAGRHDAEVIAALLHGTVLVDLGRYAEATVVFDGLIGECSARDDRFHLGVAYANRSWLWSAQGEIERCNEDLRRVIQLAREIGHAAGERIATYNLAEALLWQGAYDEALQLANRSAKLQLAHGEGAAKHDQFLVARILAARGERDELGAVLATLTSASLSPSEQAMLAILRCAHEGAAAADWSRALDAGQDLLTVENNLELWHLAAKSGVLAPDRVDHLRALQSSHPLWSKLPGV